MFILFVLCGQMHVLPIGPLDLYDIEFELAVQTYIQLIKQLL